jgi:hypothetical protein
VFFFWQYRLAQTIKGILGKWLTVIGKREEIAGIFALGEGLFEVFITVLVVLTIRKLGPCCVGFQRIL